MSRRKLIAERLVIASHNPGKIKEINALIAPFGVAGVSASALGLPVPEETENSFEGNARLKALAGARGSGLPALADDSGLEVMALGGRPGVHTADWAQTPSGRDFYQAMARVERELQELERDAKKSSPVFCKITRPNKERAQIADSEFLRFALGAKNRAARFVCCLALAWPDGHVETFQGRVEGSLTWPPRGTMGFGFDPVFVPAGEVKTFAELDPETKHAISHRADAFRQLVAACLAG